MVRLLHIPRSFAARRSLRLGACCALACLSFPATLGCNGGGAKTGASGTAAQANRPWEVIVSADTAGWIVPCGCTSNQSGGLLRRGSMVEAARREADVLVLDAGGAPHGMSRYDRLKFAAVLRGELEMKVAAHNIGAAEAALGPDELRRLAAELKAPLVSTNVFAADGKPITETVRLVEVGARRAAVFGVLSPSLAPPGVKTIAPRDAVLSGVAKLATRTELIVVLAYAPEAELTALAEELPEVDLVVGGPTGQPVPPRKVGPTLVASATNKGKFLARFRKEHPGAPWMGRIVEVDDKSVDEPQQKENLRRFYNELAALDLPAGDTSFVPAQVATTSARTNTQSMLAGTAACRKCHADDCRSWDASAHAHAWETLTASGSHVDSYCQQCHVTGFGRPGGFASVKQSLERVDVGCESCHGPSKTHALQPTVATGFVGAAADQCRRCHDRENSPKFDYDAYWKRITHGVAAARGAQPGGKP